MRKQTPLKITREIEIKREKKKEKERDLHSI